MNAIQEIKDESIRKIAQTLKASGLVGSETEAVRMAMMMSKTSQRVNQNFDQKKVGATMGLAHLHKENSPVYTEHTQSLFNTSDVNVASSVQDKPRKYEEKEEFIFGDVQEQTLAQKKDPYKLENEFEEIVAQDLVENKSVQKETQKPVAPQKPLAFASSRPVQMPIQAPAQKAWQPPRPVQVAAQSKPEFVSAPQSDFKEFKSVETSVATQTPQSTGVVSASQSSQNAFSILLGSAQKNPHYEEEVKKHSPAPAIQKPAEIHVETKPVEAPVHAQGMPRPIQAASATISPQKKMMMEANVDISKMFNFNK
ncbi:MAG: hypothetical protein ACP5N2_05785 [Candidatus Nanoarchaeia archaeon]